MKNLYTTVSIAINDKQVYLDKTYAIEHGFLQPQADHTIGFFCLTSPEGNTFKLAIEIPEEELEKAGWEFHQLFKNHIEIYEAIHGLIEEFDADNIIFPTREFKITGWLFDLSVDANGIDYAS